MFVFVENMTASAWLRWVRPYLKNNPSAEILYIEATRVGRWLAGAKARRFQFKLRDVKDKNDALVRLRIPVEDIKGVQADILSGMNATGPDRFPAYLAKSVSNGLIAHPGTLGRAMFLIQACVWKSGGAKTILLIEQRDHTDALRRYATRSNVDLIIVPRAANMGRWTETIFRSVLPSWLQTAANLVRYRRKDFSSFRYLAGLGKWIAWGNRRSKSGPRVCIEYYGQLNLDSPALYSDFFISQTGKIPAADIVGAFGLPVAPLDESRMSSLAAKGLSAVVTHPAATTVFNIPIYNVNAGTAQRSPRARYARTRANWAALFSEQNIKMYLSWFKYDEVHMAIADAMRDAGGVAALYQRAYDANASAELCVSTDIMFGFSPNGAVIERAAGSQISYYVATGYLGDHRFPALRAEAKSIREKLTAAGASRVLAYFDENSADDERWHTGHGLQREGYAFFLEKLLADERLGIVFKPKVPGTLRRRLGPVTELLSRAEATGRCVVLEKGVLHGAHPPALAALASDVAVHSCLAASTAGLEAALAGVRTVLVDREGWPTSPLYRLGPGVAFREWDDVWRALENHFASPGESILGDWSDHLSEFDPFRDGHAAQRMGDFMKWLLDAFKTGKNREQAMAEAAERYAEEWGADKISSINGASAPLALANL